MRIKKIRAKNFREALSLVKKELGADAVILSSEDRKGTRSYVEVTAAVDYDMEATGNGEWSASPGPAQNNAIPAGLPAGPHVNEILELKSEVMSLRESIETMRNSGFELKMPPERKDMFNFLKKKSITDEFALRLVERAGAIEDLETIMTDDINISRTTNNPFPHSGNAYAKPGQRLVMLIGPTGSGKTTSVAKLATMAIREGKKVAMISIDTYKIGAAEQIRIYSRMIGIPLDIVSDVDSLRKSISRFSDRDLVLIDTTGQNPSDNKYIEGLKEIYRLGLPIETQLLMSTSSDCDFLMETHKHYGKLPIDYMAFTKTDEAVKLGPIYNLCCLYQKPVAYITTGQRVPGYIEFIDSKKLTNLILRTGSA